MEHVIQWFYRGSLRTCNYSCSYCPFSKASAASPKALDRDRESLIRFVSRMLKMDEGGSEAAHCAVQIVPYGEALVHTYYWQQLARLSGGIHIDAVGAQTNLSFDVEDKLSVYTSGGGRLDKLRLWCTYHPQMTDPDSFAVQCARLSARGVRYCVGSVGDPGRLQDILKLKEALRRIDAGIYLWVNRMDGMKRNYTKDEARQLLRVDDYFEQECRLHRADSARCSQTRFVEADGRMYRCNISRRILGNLYQEQKAPHGSLSGPSVLLAEDSVCARRYCSCYLAYCNMQDADSLFFMPYPAFRIPVHPRAVFFDIDGTLLASGSRQLAAKTQEKLRRLAAHSRLYAATSLPYREAAARLRPVWDLFNGGVFLNGALCMIKKDISGTAMLAREIPLSQDSLKIIDIENLKRQSRRYGYHLRLYRAHETLCGKSHSDCGQEGQAYTKITLSFRHRSHTDVADTPMKRGETDASITHIKRSETDAAIVSMKGGETDAAITRMKGSETDAADTSVKRGETDASITRMKTVAQLLGLTDDRFQDAYSQETDTYITDTIKIAFEADTIQITAPQADKVGGIRYICEKEGCSEDDIAVFGNSPNDIPMLRQFPFSVAVNPLTTKVSQAARYIVNGSEFSLRRELLPSHYCQPKISP